MTATDPDRLQAVIRTLCRLLLERRVAPDHWDGRLSSSALSTATAILALDTAARNGYPAATPLQPIVTAGRNWLLQHQSSDGGWGDTVRSRSNISTTAIAWATLSKIAAGEADVQPAVDRSAQWLTRAAGDVTPHALRSAMLRRYGKDQTFSVPILTVLALAGKLGDDVTASWHAVPQLPFELAALPYSWFQHLRLPVVSYALPALIAIGQVRHHHAPSRNPVARLLRSGVRRRTHALLRAMQPDSGGYLEATPLTSFVVMSLAGMHQARSPVVEAGVKFLVESMRPDGSWPIDTNLATWVTTLAINALADADALPAKDAAPIQRWLLDQQSTREHPFTHAAAGGWAWTSLSGGVPDADDTSGALLALGRLAKPDSRHVAAAAAGCMWLLGVQNRDGGIPTFCRGWGTLPFDRSTPEITAHALQAWSVWHPHFDQALQRKMRVAADRAIDFLVVDQRDDGTWTPLWFGNEAAPAEENPVYGTARVLRGLDGALVDAARIAASRRRAMTWLLEAQNDDGGWGGSRDVPSSIEETGSALTALGAADDPQVATAVARGARWLVDAVSAPDVMTASPVGLYFARLWYFEDLYPIVFALSGLAAACQNPGIRLNASR